MQNMLIQGLTKLNDIKGDYLDSGRVGEGPQDPYLMIPKGQKKKKQEEKIKLLEKQNLKGSKKLLEKLKKARDGESDGSSDDGIINYQYNVSKRNEVSAIKMFNDSTCMLNYLLGKDKLFFTQENFQWKFMRDQPKLFWKTERMEDIGDFVLLFPNPDQVLPSEIPLEAENGIDFESAKEYFSQIFETQHNYPNKKKFFKSLKEAFRLAFLELDEYKTPDEKEKKRQAQELKKKSNKESSSKDKKYRDAANPTSGVMEPLATESVPLKQDARNSQAPAEKPDEQSKGPGKKIPDKPVVHVSPKDETLLKPAAEGNQKAKEADKKEEEASQNKELAKKRRVWAGQLYVRPQVPTTAKGEKEVLLPRHSQWKRNANTKARDFLTIMRKCVIAVLANQGFLMREVFVDHGKWIALVLTMPEDNLKNFAREIGLQKPVEFGCSDLMSLEPIDSKNRPLRINAYLLDEKLWEQEYLADVTDKEIKANVVELRKSIVMLLEDDCDFKSIVRLCGGTWHSNNNEESPANVIDHAVVELKEWYAYRSYLVELSFHMHEIRLLNQKMMYVLNSYYNRDRISFHGNQNRKEIDAIEIFKITTSLTVNAFKMSIKKDFKNPNISGIKLRNMWDELGCAPREYLRRYTKATTNLRPRNRTILNGIWADEYISFPHQPAEFDQMKKTLHSLPTIFQKMKQDMKNGNDVTLLGLMWESETLDIYTQLFTKMERLKIINHAVNQVVDLDALDEFFQAMAKKKQRGLANLFSLATSAISTAQTFFPLHDRHITVGKNYQRLFHNLKTLKKPMDTLLVPKVRVKFQLDEVLPEGNKLASQFGNAYKSSSTQKLSRFSGNQNGQSPRFGASSPLSPSAKPGSPTSFSQAAASSPRFTSEVIKVSQQSISGSKKFKRIGFLDGSLHAALVTRDLILKAIILLGKLPQVKDDLALGKEYLYQVLQTAKIYQDIEKCQLIAAQAKNDEQEVSANDPESLKTTNQTKQINKDNLASQLDIKFKSMFDSRDELKLKKLKQKNEFFANLGEFSHDLLRADAQSWQKVKQFYMIEDERLLDSMLQSFFTTVEMRTILIPEFKNIPLENFRCRRDQNTHHPLKDHFLRSFAIREKHFNEDEFVGYFGEKVSFFFSFLTFIQTRSWKLAIEAALLSVMDVLYVTSGEPNYSIAEVREMGQIAPLIINTVYIATKIYFCLRIMFWLSRFIGMWTRHEQGFVQRYGQQEVVDELSEGPVRALFKGIFKRDIRTDKMNEIMPEGYKRLFVKSIIVWSIFLLLMAVNFVSAYYVLSLKRSLAKKSLVGSNADDFHLADQVVFGILEVFRIIVFRYIASAVVKRALAWRNYKQRKEHETGLIISLGFLGMVNNIAVALIISYEALVELYYITDPQTSGASQLSRENQCMNPSCSNELTIYLLVYVFTQLVYIIIWKSFVRKLILYIYSKSKDLVEEVLNEKFDAKGFFKAERTIIKDNWDKFDSTDAFSKLEDDPDIQKFLRNEKPGTMNSADNLNKVVTEQISRQLISHNRRYYNLINREIDYQVVELNDGDPGLDYDPNTDEYLTIFSFIAFGCLFGVAFPLIFLLIFVAVVVDRYFDVRKVLLEEKRAVPENCESLDIWISFLRFIQSIVSVFGPFYVAFVIMQPEGLGNQLMTFGILIIANVAIISYTHSFSGEANYIAGFLSERFKMLSNRIFPSKNSSLRADLNRVKKVENNLKIFGQYVSPAGDVDVSKLAEAIDSDLELNEIQAQEKEVFMERAKKDEPKSWL